MKDPDQKICKAGELRACVVPLRNQHAAGNTVRSLDFPVVDIGLLVDVPLTSKRLEIFRIRRGMLLEVWHPLVCRDLVCRSTLPIHLGRVVVCADRRP